MNEIERLQQLAGIACQINEEETDKTVVGHVDDERDMVKKQLYQMGSYCVELYKMLGDLPDNVDFPHWWQAKVVKAADYISAAKHYLENEINVPDEEPYVDPELEEPVDPSGVS